MKRQIGILMAAWLIASAFLHADTSYLLVQGPFGPSGSELTYKWTVTYPTGTLVTGQDLLNAVLGAPVADGTYSDQAFTGNYPYFAAGNSTQGADYISFYGSYLTLAFTLNSTFVTVNDSTPAGTSTVGWNYYVAGGSGSYGGPYANTGAWILSDDGQSTRFLSNGSYDGWVYGNTGSDYTGLPATTGSVTAVVDDSSDSDAPSDFSSTGSNDVPMTVIVVPATPAITSGSTASGIEGQPFTYQITATNIPTSYGASNLPAWLGLDADSGLLSGTPTATGTFAATVSAINSSGTGTANLTITIAPPPPVITSGSTASGLQGQPFTYQITATNNPTSYGAGSLPAGLAVSAGSGLISGTPTGSGTFAASVSAINATGTGSANLTITVVPTGSLMVTLTPAAASAAGARWNVDGGLSQDSGVTLSGLPVGQYTVNFTTVPGYATPASQGIAISDTETTAVTGTYTGIPVIAVQQPAGSALESGSDTVNFGVVPFESTSQETFTLLNNGAATLTGIAADITGPDASEFQAGALGATTLLTGGSTTFTVTYSPAGIHASAATLRITSNDPVTPSFEVALAATGTNAPVNLSFAAGTFAGLVDKSGTGAGTAIAGYARFSLVKTGKVTGKLLYGGATLAIHGLFQSDGIFTGKPAGLGLILSSGSGGETNPAGYWMSGSVSAQDGTAPFNAYHAAYARKEAVAEAGKYTVLLSATDTSLSIPQGTGYAFETVAKTGGGIRMNGKLPDGTAFSVSGVLVNGPNGHEFLVFDPKLYKEKGLFAGSIPFEDLPGGNCHAAMEWMRPASGGGALYPQGFDTGMDLAGSIYVKPAKGVVLPLFVSGTLTLSDGGLSAPIAESVAVSPQGALVVTSSNPDDLAIRVDTSTGRVSGSFVHPASMKPVPFSGVLYQNATFPGAGGFFIGPILDGTSLSGNVTLSP